MRMRPGRRVAIGSRAAVYEWGAGAVAKVPFASTPDSWIADEARITEAVHTIGAPVPRLLGVESYAGRRVGIYERIEGASMWGAIRREPSAAAQHAVRLAALQAELLALGAPVGLPRLGDRLVSKIHLAAVGHGGELLAAVATVPRAEGRSVCHGDLHPGNVILAAAGPIVIDWFDAARGVPAADVARSVMLLSPACHGPSGLRHLPGGGDELLDRFRTAYLDAVTARLGIALFDVEAWMPIVAAARLAEGVEPDGLLRRWRAGRAAADT